jgi:tetratricopeptide (TPR) repeat protein
MHWKPARWLAFLAASGMIGLVLFVLIRGDLNVLLEIPVVGNLAGALFIRPDRLEVYRHSLALLAEQPFTGIGLGNAFSLVYSRYELLLTVPFLGYSHNLLLEVWLQQGIIGAAAFIWLVTSLYAKVLLGYNTFRADIRLQAATAGLTATLLHGLSDARQYQSLWTWLQFFFLLGLCAASLVNMQPRSLRSGWLLPGGIATVLLLLVLILRWPPQAAWDANRAALLQTRADLNGALSSNQRTTMRIESEALFRRALNADPDSVQINRRFGLLLLEEGRYEEAIPHLVIAYQNTPQHLATQKGLGLAYLWNGELEKAAMLLAGLPGITEELQGLAWQEYNDFHHYQTALYAYQLLDRLQPGQPSNQEMIRILQEKLGAP